MERAPTDARTGIEVLAHTEVLAELVEVAGRDVVDVGCGSGELVRWLRAAGARPVGVECGEIMLGLARRADPDHAGDYRPGVAQALPLDDACADVVVFSYSLHHVPAEAMPGAFAEAHRVLRPGGCVYVVEPVAAGPGHEVIRIVDDETEVRAHAQAALARAHEAGLERVLDTRYTSRMVVPDAAALAARVVGVDPSRAARLEARRDEFDAAFARHATTHGRGFAFDQDNLVTVLRRA